MKRLAVIPGTFDPVTTGHFDLAKRAAEIFDEVVLLVANNSEKKTRFSASERFDIADAAFRKIPNISVQYCGTTVADAANLLGACCIVKGVRGSVDYEYETQIFGAMRALGAPDTVFFPVRSEYADISSTFVRELFRYHKDYAAYVPEGAHKVLQKLLGY